MCPKSANICQQKRIGLKNKITYFFSVGLLECRITDNRQMTEENTLISFECIYTIYEITRSVQMKMVQCIYEAVIDH